MWDIFIQIKCRILMRSRTLACFKASMRRDVTKTGMGNGEWGMGNGEWGMGNGEWGMRNSGQR